MRRVNFDMDALRSYCTGLELGSFAKAADKLGRSTSAISTQLKKLEEQAGTALLHKAGRGLAPTAAGEVLLGYARRILELNDEGAMAVGALELDGQVRLGMQEDFGEQLLPDVLGRFARSHPHVAIEAQIARNADLVAQIETGKLDLALAWHRGGRVPNAELLGEFPMEWIASAAQPPAWLAERSGPLPLVAMQAPCLMRTAATEALDRAGIPWRIVLTSPSLAGVRAAVAAGLGVTVRTRLSLRPDLALVEGVLPALPAIGLAIYRADAEASPACERLRAIVRDAVLEPALAE